MSRHPTRTTHSLAMGIEERDVVRRGYAALSYHCRRDDADDGQYAPWLTQLHTRLPAVAAVLDIGCGCGVPVARSLAGAGHQVTGVDISDVQIERARRLVPSGAFIRADATRLNLQPASFDAVVCLYSLIHVPLPEQPRLIGRIASWLRPGGWLLATAGHTPGPAPKTTGSTARPRCGGATPTPPPTSPGSSNPT
jgi:2-polyprenyl-3-methyl-5-hydroxy-6-metoxy-1,4-benzoquinol methylase